MPGTEVVVIGSANVDHVVRLARVPDAGETVPADAYSTGVGGKGLNQAVAAARAGARTAFVGAVGADHAGAAVISALAADGIAADHVAHRADAATGSAHIFVEAGGANRIAVVPGANATLDPVDVRQRLGALAPRTVLLQLEISRPVVVAAARQARELGAHVLLTPSPLGDAPLARDLLDAVTLLTLNEVEAATITGQSSDRVLDRLLELVPAVVLTLGPRGARYADRGGARVEVEGLDVPVLDTTAAGDTFAGYLAAGIAREQPIGAALTIANAAAACCVGRAGAVSAIPRRADVAAAARTR